jgi:phage terminase Nu1 subunit (DNA packaging protein)
MAEEVATADPVIVNLEELADAMGVTQPTVKGYLKDGMPVVEEGSNGVPYRLDLRACLAWRDERNRRIAEEAAKKTADAAQLAMAFTGGENGPSAPTGALSAKDRIEAVTAAFKEDQFAQARGHLCTKAEFQADMSAMFTSIRLELMGLTALMQRELGLDTAQAAKVTAWSRDVLRRMAAHARDLELRRRLEGTVDEADAA